MSGTSSSPGAPAREYPDGQRPLPPRPSLEFEHKRAKKLLREMQRANPAAKLADVQWAIAREYGFRSWPKLVAYFTVLARHEVSGAPPAWYRLDHFEKNAANMLGQHSAGYLWAARLLATFVPHLYGKSAAEVLASTVTIDDARLVVARQNRLPSWAALIEFAESPERNVPRGWDAFAAPPTPGALASKAVSESDLVLLSQILDAHPELLNPVGRLEQGRGSLLAQAVGQEWNSVDRPAARAVTDYLVSRGMPLAETLNSMLMRRSRFGVPGMKDQDAVAFAEFLMDRGADPDWIAPNGVSVIEHLLLSSRGRGNVAAVIDAIAPRAKPRPAFWVAAGLGDVPALGRYFDRDGALTDVARHDRPDFTAVGPSAMPSLPDADDLEILWEAFYIAALNSRWAALDALLARGFPIDHAPWGSTMLRHGVGSHNVALVEYLVSHGATFDIKGASPAQMDEWLYDNDPLDPATRRIYEICGGKSADAVTRHYEEEQAKPAPFGPALLGALEEAGVDAVQLGRKEVGPDNLLVGVLRAFVSPLTLGMLQRGGVDIARLRGAIAPRLMGGGRAEPPLPYNAAAQDVLDRAAAEAKKKRRRGVQVPHLLYALVEHDVGPVAELLTAAGGSMQRLREDRLHIGT